MMEEELLEMAVELIGPENRDLTFPRECLKRIVATHEAHITEVNRMIGSMFRERDTLKQLGQILYSPRPDSVDNDSMMFREIDQDAELRSMFDRIMSLPGFDDEIELQGPVEMNPTAGQFLFGLFRAKYRQLSVLSPPLTPPPDEQMDGVDVNAWVVAAAEANVPEGAEMAVDKELGNEEGDQDKSSADAAGAVDAGQVENAEEVMDAENVVIEGEAENGQEVMDEEKVVSADKGENAEEVMDVEKVVSADKGENAGEGEKVGEGEMVGEGENSGEAVNAEEAMDGGEESQEP